MFIDLTLVCVHTCARRIASARSSALITALPALLRQTLVASAVEPAKMSRRTIGNVEVQNSRQRGRPLSSDGSPADRNATPFRAQARRTRPRRYTQPASAPTY